MAIDYSIYYQLFGFACGIIILLVLFIAIIIQAVFISKTNKRLIDLESAIEDLKEQDNSSNNKE